MGRDVAGLGPTAVKPKPSSNKDICGYNQEINHLETSEQSMEGNVSPFDAGIAKVASHENGTSKQDVLVKSMSPKEDNNQTKLPGAEEVNPSTPEKPNSSAVENEETTKHVVEKPLDLSGDHQRAYSSPKAAETPVSGDDLSAHDVRSPCSSKMSQHNTSFMSEKQLDDEDNWSMTSSTAASVRTARSRTTVAVAPKFTISDRLEKRKEFYAKLDEKHQALEAEKREYEARSKEEQEAAVKQLRKNMVFRANPVPSFYYEGPPPKKEVKKLPTTRPVSPKFNRRRSFGDAVTSSTSEKVAGARPLRHSLGSNRRKDSFSESTPASTAKKKGTRAREQSGGKSGSLKKEASAPAQLVSSIAQNMTEQANGDITVQS